MEREELRWRIEEVEMELADLYSMSEEAACFRYNADNKEEVIDILNAELNTLYKRLDEVVSEESDECSIGWVDQAFKSLADFERMRI
jgi:hypothetical protein